MKRQFTNLKVGILGGGQLAKMMSLEAQRLGVQLFILSENSKDPAAQSTAHWQQGKLDNKKDLKTFIDKMDVVGFESEFIDTDLLREIQSESNTKILPRPFLMSSLRDRLSQKQLLLKHKLPTAEFHKLEKPEQLPEILKNFGGKMVIKKRLFGYDGYGTFVIKSTKELDSFIKDHWKENTYIAEKFIAFKRELAIQYARNASGDLVELPLCETYQKDSRCFWVKGPAKHRKFKNLSLKMRQFLNSINYIGVFAFEIFDIGSELTINEVAPRVHNSGHHTQNSLETSQFAYHVLALMNAPLPKVKSLSKGFAMVNLLGRPSKVIKWSYPKDCSTHWYGKEESREGRKMGHLNAIDDSADKALRTCLKAEKGFQI